MPKRRSAVRFTSVDNAILIEGQVADRGILVEVKVA